MTVRDWLVQLKTTHDSHYIPRLFKFLLLAGRSLIKLNSQVIIVSYLGQEGCDEPRKI